MDRLPQEKVPTNSSQMAWFSEVVQDAVKTSTAPLGKHATDNGPRYLTETPLGRLDSDAPEFDAVRCPAAGDVDIGMHLSGIVPVQSFYKPGQPVRSEIEKPPIDLPSDVRCTRPMSWVMPLVLAPAVMQECKHGHEGTVTLQFPRESHAVRQHRPPVNRAMNTCGPERKSRLRLSEQSCGVDITEFEHESAFSSSCSCPNGLQLSPVSLKSFGSGKPDGIGPCI